jgi:hypothetical protein
MVIRLPGRFGASRGALLALAASAVLAAGCGSDEEPATTASEGTPAAGSTEAAAPEAEPGGGSEQGGGDQGGVGPGSSTEPEPLTPQQLRAMVEQFFTSGDPALACDELVSESLIETAYGDHSGCAAAQVPGSVADAVAVSGIRIDDGRALATAVPAGGASDGIEVRVELERTGSGWLIASLDADVPVGP